MKILNKPLRRRTWKADFGRMKMCHMIADTRAELIAMATTPSRSSGPRPTWTYPSEGAHSVVPTSSSVKSPKRTPLLCRA